MERAARRADRRRDPRSSQRAAPCFPERLFHGVALSVGAALLLTVVLAKALGCMLPVFAKAVKLDPALMASPILATIVDALSLVFLFAISSKVLSI